MTLNFLSLECNTKLNYKPNSSFLILSLSIFLLASACKSGVGSTGPAQKLYSIDTIAYFDTIRTFQNGNQAAPFFVSQGAPVMYTNCKNVINVDLPGNPGTFTLTSTNATIIVAPNQTMFSIIPTGQLCTLKGSIFSNGEQKVVYNSTFSTTQPPKPSLQLIVNGKEYNGLTPISSNSTISVKVKADPFFAANFADDATYEIDVVEILVQRSLGLPTKVSTINTSGQNATNGIFVNTSGTFRADPPGTKCYVKINKVFRRTSTNQLIEVDFNENELALGFVIR